jgi:apolipoprotein N-acyltransferase
MSRLRAVEHGRAVLIAATSGISAIIGPDGKVIDRTREFTADTITLSVPLRDDLTPAARMGAVPEWIIAGTGVLAVLLVVVRTRRSAATALPDSPAQRPERSSS